MLLSGEGGAPCKIKKDARFCWQISNLKQYFPVGKKGLFVKANDGISIDIYEGETFGLVGESGCGKSTLGRSVLQLYKQTDGRTMYFGRTIDEIAPQYAYRTVPESGGPQGAYVCHPEEIRGIPGGI